MPRLVRGAQLGSSTHSPPHRCSWAVCNLHKCAQRSQERPGVQPFPHPPQPGRTRKLRSRDPTHLCPGFEGVVRWRRRYWEDEEVKGIRFQACPGDALQAYPGLCRCPQPPRILSAPCRCPLRFSLQIGSIHLLLSPRTSYHAP